MPINKAMELIYNLIHEQSESFTSDQLEALNLGLSALKTVEDFKLNNVSRETILGKKLIELAGFDCHGKSCSKCKHFDSVLAGCTSSSAGYLIHLFENETKA